LAKLHVSRCRGEAAVPDSGGASHRRGSSCVELARVRDERGQAVIEFALVLPILAALVVVLLQFGRVIYMWISLTHLANEGARYATVNGFPGGATSPGNFLCPKLATDGASTGKTVIATFIENNNTAGTTAGDGVSVQVKENYKLIPYWHVATIPLTVTASMRLEQTPSFAAGTSTC
jgi:Flp pilus assembly protein TadG